MTTVFEREVSGRRTHALVIGVGDYPLCGPDSLSQVARDIRPLAGAPVTAVRVARWLMERQRGDPVAPLASLDVAITPHPGQEGRLRDAFGGERLSRATWAGVSEAFRDWRDRLDQPGGGVAWFYFCGHGLSPDPYSHVLLLEDFNADEHAPFSTAVDFGGTYTGMERVRARTQVFFLDTCREVPRVPPGMSTAGKVLLEPDGTLDSRPTALVTYATGFGHRAYGGRRVPVRFRGPRHPGRTRRGEGRHPHRTAVAGPGRHAELLRRTRAAVPP